MTIHFEIGWSLLPLLVSVIALVWASLQMTDDPGTYGSGALYNLMIFATAIIPSLVAWLIWALLT